MHAANTSLTRMDAGFCGFLRDDYLRIDSKLCRVCRVSYLGRSRAYAYAIRVIQETLHTLHNLELLPLPTTMANTPIANVPNLQP